MPEFSQIRSHDADPPHRFAAYQHSLEEGDCLTQVAQEALKAWDLSIEAFQQVETTGFDGAAFAPLLNAMGQQQLPLTPQNDENVTKAVPVTDLSEILALRLLRQLYEPMRFPRARVMNKEWAPAQHRGIDIIGYMPTDDSYRLVVVEVMASVENSSPPGTVSSHRKQLLDETFAENPSVRLQRDLRNILDDCTEITDRNIFNDAIICVLTGTRPGGHASIAVAVLVREAGALQENDWTPFVNGTADFAGARIPSDVAFFGIQCDRGFCALMDVVKERASGTRQGNAA